VAEDNQVNQLVAKRIFEKLGHSVKVVENGEEAVSALESGRFDLVAMDVQMPIMDGLDATAAIRKAEEKTGKHVPIVAMTAHAMKGDRERCLNVGMDGYVAKPIRSLELEKAISEVVAKAQPLTEDNMLGDGSVLDSRALLEGVGGNRRLLLELAELFLADLPRLVARIKTALGSSNAEELARAAHALKGSVGNFGASKAMGSADKIEMFGKSGDFSSAAKALATLESELAQVTRELQELATSASKRRSRLRRA
jgi:CheY-like chemotaxis protein